MVETNGVGNPLFDMLQSKYANLIPWNNSNVSKIDAVESLILAFVGNELKIPTKELYSELDFQLGVFTYDYNAKSRTIRYYAKTPHHDDEVISIMLANKCMKENRFAGGFMTYTPTNRFGY